MIQRSLSKNSKVLNDSNVNTCENLMLALVKANSECEKSDEKRSCSICSAESLSPDNTSNGPEDSSGHGEEDNSMAIVPLEASSSSISLLIRELPEIRPGWPLLRRAISSEGSSVQKISVVQWAMRIPGRSCLQITNLDEKRHSCECDKGEKNVSCERDEGQSGELNGDNGAIVLVGNENASTPSSPNRSSCSLPIELESLHEKYAATCRLFKYKELRSATSNFKPGLFLILRCLHF